MIKPVIFGMSGTVLTEAEKEFFIEAKPFGFILFSRNCVDGLEAVTKLTAELRGLFDYEVLISIDQEGGRVRRLKNEEHGFIECPSAYNLVKDLDIVGEEIVLQRIYDNYFNITKELLKFGIDTNYAPVADLLQGGHDIIGDRSFGSDIEFVYRANKKTIEAISDAGGNYCIKHMPGHGRALVDSHEELPLVEASLEELEQTDFAVFKKLHFARMAMTAHVVYKALDDRPATLSKKVISYIRNEIGYKGLIITDDINMKALSGNVGEIAAQALEAGCDIVLHCSGNLEEMKEVAANLEQANILL